MKYFFSLLIFSALTSCVSTKQHCAKAIVQTGVHDSSEGDTLSDEQRFVEFEKRITSDAFIFLMLQKCGISNDFSKVPAYRDSIYCDRTGDQSNLVTVFVWQASPERAVMFMDTLLVVAVHTARIDYERSFASRVDSINSALSNAAAWMSHEKARLDSLKVESKIGRKDSIAYQQAMSAFVIAEKEHSVCSEEKLALSLELVRPGPGLLVIDKAAYIGQTAMRK